MNKNRSIWKNLGWALAATPIVSFIGIIVITLVSVVDDAITKIHLAGYWWLILIISYILSLIYFISEPRVRKNLERKKVVNALILYLQEQLEKQGEPPPSDEELVREMLLERVKIWAWSKPDLWIKYFPDEQYSKHLFGIVDNFIVYLQYQKNKYAKK